MNLTYKLPLARLAPIAVMASMMFAAPMAFADGTLEERLDQLQKQLDGMQNLKKEVDELKAQLAQEKEARNEDKAAMVAADTSAKESVKSEPATTIGGYGELTYSKFKDEDTNPTTADLRRFVMFLGHRFNDRLTFQSEIEVEHAVASEDDEGEVEIEQAYLSYNFNDTANVKAGLFLIPLGLLNENHEPPAFFGVNRNSVETRIIPTTWREGGVGFYGGTENGFGYDIGVTTGFDSGKIDEPSFGIASGHQELQLAHADDLSVYGSLKYTGQPGLLLGTGVFTGNTGQNGASNPMLKGVDARFTLGEVHARYTTNKFDLQALYARGTLGDSNQVTAAIGKAAPKTFSGWYTQMAYHILTSNDMDFAPFIRYERYDIDEQENPAAGIFSDPDDNDRITTVGLNFKPVADVVLKADYQHYENIIGSSSFNLGLGYMF